MPRSSGGSKNGVGRYQPASKDVRRTRSESSKVINIAVDAMPSLQGTAAFWQRKDVARAILHRKVNAPLCIFWSDSEDES